MFKYTAIDLDSVYTPPSLGSGTWATTYQHNADRQITRLTRPDSGMINFDHSYCAARLQTLDCGASVSLYTVSRELGHRSEDMVRRVYSHLGAVRHRSEVVEYRIEQHYEGLGEQLRRLGFVTKIDTIADATSPNADPHEHLSASGGESYDVWARRDSNA